MTVTSIDLDPRMLELAKKLTGAKSNREVVSTALRTVIAVHGQPAAVDRIIAREFTDDQTSAPVRRHGAPEQPETPSSAA